MQLQHYRFLSYAVWAIKQSVNTENQKAAGDRVKFKR